MGCIQIYSMNNRFTNHFTHFLMRTNIFHATFYCIKYQTLQKIRITKIQLGGNMMNSSRKFLFILILFFAISSAISGSIFTNPVQAFSNQVIQRGAVGDDVIELQARLQYNGYYHGRIDGVFGWGTYWSVRNFQHDFGLKEVDGLVGEETKNMLARATKYYRDFVINNLKEGKDFTHYGGVPLDIQSGPSEEMKAKFKKEAEAKRGAPPNQAKSPQTKQNAQNQNQQNNQQPNESNENAQNQEQEAKQEQSKQEQPKQEEVTEEKAQPSAVNMPSGFSQNDLQLMANAVYGEARGEPYIGQVAVAAVILNRVESPSFPNTASGVIFEPGAFTAVSDGQIWLTPNETARKAVLDAMNGWDPTENALYYFNPNTATSAWIWSRPQIKQIGKHIFCE